MHSRIVYRQSLIRRRARFCKDDGMNLARHVPCQTISYRETRDVLSFRCEPAQKSCLQCEKRGRSCRWYVICFLRWTMTSNGSQGFGQFCDKPRSVEYLLTYYFRIRADLFSSKEVFAHSGASAATLTSRPGIPFQKISVCDGSLGFPLDLARSMKYVRAVSQIDASPSSLYPIIVKIFHLVGHRDPKEDKVNTSSRDSILPRPGSTP